MYNKNRCPVIKQTKKIRYILKWIIKLIVPSFLIGHPNLWDNLKTLRKHPNFKPLRTALATWLIFSLTISSIGTYSIFTAPLAKAQVTNYNRTKSLDVRSVSGTPIINKAIPIFLTDGDDSTTGTGTIVLDWTNISDKSDIAVYDENKNLLDYYFEEFDTTNKTAVIWVYRDWVRDGSTQAQIAYGNGPSDRSVTKETVFDKETNLVGGWLLNEDSGNALDVTSNNNDGTVHGATQGATGQVDGAYDFDGSDDYVNAPVHVPLFENSLSAWLYLDHETYDGSRNVALE